VAAGEVKGNTRAAARLARSQGAIGQMAAFPGPSAGRQTMIVQVFLLNERPLIRGRRGGPPVQDLDERRGQGEATGLSGGEAGDGLLRGGNGALLGGDDLIRQSGERLREPPQGQEIPERALEPPSCISTAKPQFEPWPSVTPCNPQDSQCAGRPETSRRPVGSPSGVGRARDAAERLGTGRRDGDAGSARLTPARPRMRQRKPSELGLWLMDHRSGAGSQRMPAPGCALSLRPHSGWSRRRRASLPPHVGPPNGTECRLRQQAQQDLGEGMASRSQAGTVREME